MRIVSTLFLGVLVFLGTSIGTLAAESPYGVPAPTLFAVTEASSQPLITGVTFNQTKVDVYIDGNFSGRATVNDHESGVANFAYRPATELSVGSHTIHTIARSLDETVRSRESASITVTIADIKPQITNLDASVDETGKTRITGNIPNGMAVKISIEGREFVTFTPPAATRGPVTSFWYRPGIPTNSYTVSAVAIATDGTTSDVITKELDFVLPGTGSVVSEQPMEDTTNTSDEVMQEETEDDTAMTNDETSTTDPRDVLDKLEEQEEPIAIIDESDESTVMVDEEAAEGDVRIEDTPEDATIVTPEAETTDEQIVFGENEADEAAIEGGVAETDSDANDGNFNRIAGFLVLLVVAIVLALWYVREKEIDKKAKENNQTSFDDLPKQQDKQTQDNQQQNQQQHKKNKKKKNKKNR